METTKPKLLISSKSEYFLSKLLYKLYYACFVSNYRLFAENNENFSYEDCHFEVQKARESTARVVMWREFNLINSFTLEASFCGPSKGTHKGCHFNPTILKLSLILFLWSFHCKHDGPEFLQDPGGLCGKGRWNLRITTINWCMKCRLRPTIYYLPTMVWYY